jgi:hypothetical protein
MGRIIAGKKLHVKRFKSLNFFRLSIRFLPVGEVCPHALAFSVKHAQKPDCLGKTVPFLR